MRRDRLQGIENLVNRDIDHQAAGHTTYGGIIGISGDQRHRDKPEEQAGK